MHNLIKAAEAGYRGPVAGALDYLLVSNLKKCDAVMTVEARA
jgi:hypothetical protein